MVLVRVQPPPPCTAIMFQICCAYDLGLMYNINPILAGWPNGRGAQIINSIRDYYSKFKFVDSLDTLSIDVDL